MYNVVADPASQTRGLVPAGPGGQTAVRPGNYRHMTLEYNYNQLNAAYIVTEQIIVLTVFVNISLRALR